MTRRGKDRSAHPRQYDISLQAQLKNELRALGLVIKETTGDGNCLFRSLSDQLFGHENEHRQLREGVCRHIEAHPDLYAPFVIEEALQHYVSRMRQDGVYGGNMELVAFARYYGNCVAVHQAGLPVWIVEPDTPSPDKKSLHLAFYQELEHYDSIRPQDAASNTVKEFTITLRAPTLDTSHDHKQSEGPNSMERMVMKSTGCDDLVRIRELVQKHRNPNKVVEILWEERIEKESFGTGVEQQPGNISTHEVADTTSPDQAADGPSGNDTSNTETTRTSDTTQSTEQPQNVQTKSKPRKLSARERKELAKKTQKEKAKARKRNEHKAKLTSSSTTDDVETKNVIEGIKVLKI